MLSVISYRVIVLTIGTLYPAYRSYKAVRTKNVKEYVKWMMYWIVFAFLTVAEAIGDIFVAFWFPFYYEIKIVFILWLISPWTKGAALIYKNWLHPWLIKNEKDIDFFIDQLRSEGYNQVMNIGTKGLMCARDIVTTAALRSQEQLAQQLQRSYSLNDVGTTPRRPNATRRNPALVSHEEEQSTDEEPATEPARLFGQDQAVDDNAYQQHEGRQPGDRRTYNLRSRTATVVSDEIFEEIYHDDA